MKHDLDELDRIILEVVSCDIEPFESVVSKLSQWFHTDQIQSSLLCNTMNGLIGAYIIHADPPYITAVSVSAGTIDRFWFHITESGTKYLRAAVGKQWSFARESLESV